MTEGFKAYFSEVVAKLEEEKKSITSRFAIMEINSTLARVKGILSSDRSDWAALGDIYSRFVEIHERSIWWRYCGPACYHFDDNDENGDGKLVADELSSFARKITEGMAGYCHTSYAINSF